MEGKVKKQIWKQIVVRVGHADPHITKANQQRQMHICLFVFEHKGQLTVITVREKSVCCVKI